ncbi:Indoleamine 2,3-dioxygenase [Collybia nuda]|uniref:Indoleamine 2,3-dioxygenase n=1 Tax=Collybia nuda TaxID=64659 RepID=A0A9P6CGE9_9AGAR|nr:Indoleamine 2,3-dioxygenase [Collybia nuda]
MGSLDIPSAVLNLRDFDINFDTGFLPRQTPLLRLPSKWEAWELILESAIHDRIKLGETSGLSEEEREKSESWRNHVRALPVLPTAELKESEVFLRRAHHVLTYILHFYVHSILPHDPISIPPSLTLPLLRVSAELLLPPTMSYSDDVLHNWKPKTPHFESGGEVPTIDNLRCQTSFTGSADEDGFYLSTVRVELRGGAVLELMQAILNDASTNDKLALQRITDSLTKMAVIIKELRALLLGVREECNPEYFFREIRPWLVGTEPAEDSATRPWVFEGLDQDPNLQAPAELSGSSAAQSTLIQGLDTFLGVDTYTLGEPKESPHHVNVSPFAQRMRLYMPRRHREFLAQLVSNPFSLRELVANAKDACLQEAYNGAVLALKEFRDAHMIIVTLYIIGPGRRAAREAAEAGLTREGPVKGSAGGDLARLLKDFRDRTTGAVFPEKKL